MKISGVKIINNVEHIKINPFEKVKVISIVSAKGGVGKSNVAFKIANELVRRGKKVALVDADILGSSIPKLAGEFSELNVLNGKILPNKLSNGLEIISSQYFISNSNNKAIVWRATIFNSLLRKFFEETKYQDDLEYLILDMPPGTGDTLLNLNAYFEEVYSIVVTTPSEDANYVSLRIVDVLKDLNHKIIGLINNMAFYDVQEVKHYIFGKEDIRGICLQKKIKFLGDIPIKGEDKYFSNDYLDKYYIKIVEDIVHEVDKY